MNKLNYIFFVLGSFLLMASAISCNDLVKNNNSIATPEETAPKTQLDTLASSEVKQHQNVDEIVMAYLTLKNTLMESQTETSKKDARKLLIALKEYNTKGFSSEEQKELKIILEDAIEQTTHISGSELKHQREHFVAVSEDVLELIAIAGTTKTLYQDFCPMYNNGKGAVWISETKAIKNPYFGAGNMLSCGNIQNVIN